MSLLTPTRVLARTRRSHRHDLTAAALACGLVAAATAVGFAWHVRISWVNPAPGPIRVFGEWPVLGQWLPRVGPGTPFALLAALAAVAWGPRLAARLPWRAALIAGYLLAVSWTFSLAMVDGWRDGVAGPLARGEEYLAEVPGITDIPTMLRTFTSRILDYQPDSWVTHVSGHPPGATLVFVWLDRLGLSGPGWAGVVCILVGCLTAVAVPVTISALDRPAQPGTARPGTTRPGTTRPGTTQPGTTQPGTTRLGTTRLGRAALPFAALFPGAVWVGVSADGLFAGATATGIALLALGATRPWGPGAAARCLAGGLLLGFGLFLSYGLVLLGLVALAVVLVTRSWRALLTAGLAVLGVVAAFTLAGFWWVDGYHLVVQRYYQGIGAARPYSYWVWANLACLVLAVGPATAAGLRRVATAVAQPRITQPWTTQPWTTRPWTTQPWTTRPWTTWARSPVPVLVAAAALAVLFADLSGLSKAEVERIWLPFAVWLVAAAALLPAPARRWWLAGQALTALVVNHVLLTGW